MFGHTIKIKNDRWSKVMLPSSASMRWCHPHFDPPPLAGLSPKYGDNSAVLGDSFFFLLGSFGGGKCLNNSYHNLCGVILKIN